eukprot:COSAG01_NODE_2874_length_6937_cov_4.473823_4_plen_97_part_00
MSVGFRQRGTAVIMMRTDAEMNRNVAESKSLLSVPGDGHTCLKRPATPACVQSLPTNVRMCPSASDLVIVPSMSEMTGDFRRRSTGQLSWQDSPIA